MKYNYQLFDTNGGFLALAVLDGDTCVYYLYSNHRDLVMSTLEALKHGGDPIADGWDGGEDDPQECYRSIVEAVEQRSGGAWELDA